MREIKIEKRKKERKIRIKEKRPILKKTYFDNEFPVRMKTLPLLTIESVMVTNYMYYKL
jgi:hypothetical protein